MREWDVGKEWKTDEFGRSEHVDRSRMDNEGRRGRRGGERKQRDKAREPVSKDDLDAELDAFLKG